MKINSFKDLLAWKISYQLAIEIYKTTQKFPKHELFGITNQIRRAVVSISSNIAEGFSREGRQEKKQFYRYAKSSATEVESQLLLSLGLKYVSKEDFKKINELLDRSQRLLHGLIKNIPQ